MMTSRSRYTSLLVFAMFFFGICFITRVMLLVFENDASLYSPMVLGKVFTIGLLYDSAALSWMLIPFSLVALFCSKSLRGRTIHKWLSTALFVGFAGSLIFQVVSEFLFWNEFSSRFNFIAVDYLIYTREVFGNIWQSYPIELMLAGIFVVSVIAAMTIGRRYFHIAGGESPPFLKRLKITAGLGLLPALFFFGLGDGPNNLLDRPSERELAWNGHYSLFRAFNNNDLSYPAFYATLPSETVQDVIGATFPTANTAAELSVERQIIPLGPAIRKNIVLISIESLGSDYVEAF
ncbi:MAG: hypothetical protein HON65_02445, partial [Rhodospirillales bacterium]|nr:hypothetical protein [Rhodospirillales bacterium]